MRRMLAWSIPSAIAWSAVVSSLGFWFGRSLASFVDRIGLAVSAVVVLAILVG